MPSDPSHQDANDPRVNLVPNGKYAGFSRKLRENNAWFLSQASRKQCVVSLASFEKLGELVDNKGQPYSIGHRAWGMMEPSGTAPAPLTAYEEVSTVVMQQERPASAGPLRRVPVQGRSLARVQRMLDACAALVDEVGYDGLSTTLLAERAGVAIGSVYQFFPDKRAIVAALTQRSLEAYLGRLSLRISDGGVTNWWDAVDAAIDEYIAMHRTVPGFRTLHFGDVVDRNLLDEERDNNAVIVEQLGEMLVTEFGVPDQPRIRFALAIAVETADGLIKYAFRRDPEGDDAVLAETKSLIRDYLNRAVGSG
jgi:AcrR family transcriptional regulator